MKKLNPTKALGKKKRLALFEIQLKSLIRIIALSDTKSTSVFSNDIPGQTRDWNTCKSVKQSFEVYRQDDIWNMKTMLFHLDPCPNKSNYEEKVSLIQTWAKPDERILEKY